MKIESVLTPVEMNVLNIIIAHHENHLPLPTLREIAMMLHYKSERSNTWVYATVNKLVQLGFLTKERYRARTIVPTVRFIPVQQLEINRVNQVR